MPGASMPTPPSNSLFTRHAIPFKTSDLSKPVPVFKALHRPSLRTEYSVDNLQAGYTNSGSETAEREQKSHLYQTHLSGSCPSTGTRKTEMRKQSMNRRR